MKAASRMLALYGLFVLVFACAVSHASDEDIIHERRGTRCGNPDSVEIDLRNDSRKNLRGYALFERSDGRKEKVATGLVYPGGTTNLYICDGTGEYSIRVNFGTDPSYPE